MFLEIPAYISLGLFVVASIIQLFFAFQEKERQSLTNILCVHENLNALCQDAKGMCVVKKLIGCTKDINNKCLIINGVHSHCLEIAQSPYGNYIIQFLFQTWSMQDLADVIKLIIMNSSNLVRQKFSSKVIEKALDIFNKNDKEKLIINFVLNSDIIEILKNQYSHHALIKAIKYMNNKIKNKLVLILTNMCNEDKICKKDKSRIRKFLPNLYKYNK